MKKLNIPVCVEVKNVTDEIDFIESVQALAENLTLENLKLLAKKSKKKGVNQKIQTYKKLI